MTDNSVFITGAAEGAFADALAGLPPWATADTALDIETILKKLLGIQTTALSQLVKTAKAGGTGLTPADAEKLSNEVDKITKSFKRINEEDDKKRKREKEDEKNDDEVKERSVKQKALDYLGQKALVALTSSGTKLFGVQKQYYQTSKDLFNSGVNLLNGNDSTTSSMESLNQIITLTDVRLETFQKAIEKYTASVNAVGVNKFAKTINLASANLKDLGFSSAEQIDLIGSMMETESAYTDLRSRSEKDLAVEAERFGRQIKNLSLLTGQSADKLKESTKEASKNSDIMAVEARYGADAARRVTEFAGALPAASEAIISLASSSSQANEEIYQTLVKAGAGPEADKFRDTITNLTNGTISTETAIKQMGDTAKSLNSVQIESLRLQKTAGNPAAKPTQDFIYALRGVSNTTSQASEAQIDAATKSKSSVAKFASEWEALLSGPERAFPLMEKQLDIVTAGLKELNSVIDSLIKSTSATTRNEIGLGIEVAAALVSVATASGMLKSILNGAGGLVKGTFSLVTGTIENVLGTIAKVSPVMNVLLRGAGLAGAGLFAAYEVFSLVKAGMELWDAKQHEKEANRQALSLEEQLKKLTPEERAKAKDMTEFKRKLTPEEKAKEASKEEEKLKPVSLSPEDKERIDNLTKAAAIATERNAPVEDRVKRPVEISVPKDPSPSTINSPSAIPADPTGSTADTSPMAPQASEAAVGSGIEKPPRTSDINSLLSYQSAILEQILLASTSLVSVNKDILKYSRVNS